jgi:AraC family transcriptional regulator, regulatory protein of adaptative response / methylated-DNA-[protein]-cysteine methyltransferase
MNTQEIENFNRITKAISYISNNFRDQPDLDEIADKIHLSPHHFQRLFTDWAGVSPKKFIQYISLQRAKQVLQNNASLSEAAYESGLSGTGRLHDLFVTIEGMTPGEFKYGGSSLVISYDFYVSRFGKLLIASTPKGICHVAFADEEEAALAVLKDMFPKAEMVNQTALMHSTILHVFSADYDKPEKIKLHLKGTQFQLKVWEALLKIPEGKLSTYGAVANAIGKRSAARAVGTAIGDNPVAFIIPCHRVIQASGVIGNYMWGKDRKIALIGWEAAQADKPVQQI